MPLIHSKGKRAFSKNVSAEMDAGKPQDQSLAIAYDIKRKAGKKKMAHGGMATEASCAHGGMAMCNEGCYAKGGQVENPKLEQAHMDMPRASSMAEAIMRKRKMMAEGGMVDLDNHEDGDQAEFDDQNELAAKKELYDDEQLSPQPMDSNEHGDDLSDEDKYDMVSSIRRRMKMKRG